MQKNSLKIILGWCVLSCLAFARTSVAGPAFKTGASIKAYVGESLSVDLRTLLSDEGSGILTWSGDADQPKWLSIDSRISLASGQPAATDAGTENFQLTVTDNTGAHATAVVPINVAMRPEWKIATGNVLDLGLINEGQPINVSLKNLITVPAGTMVVFSSTNLPGWMHLNPDGSLSGIPARADVATTTGIQFIATTAAGESSNIQAKIQVQKVVHPPKWNGLQSPVYQAKADQPFQQDISGLVSNIEQADLTFDIPAGAAAPSWVKLTSAGVLYGQPSGTDVGTKVFPVRLTGTVDGTTYTDNTSVSINVAGTAHPPQWKANPLILPSASAGSPYDQTLLDSVNNPDGGPLTFSVVTQPGDWVSINPTTGEFKGTPPATLSGLQTWVAKVTNQAGLTDQTTIEITVVRPPDPPRWSSHPVALGVNAQEEQYFSLDLTKLIKNPSNVDVQFVKVVGPDKDDWAEVTANGILQGIPTRANVPMTSYQVRVTSSAGNDDTTINIPILKVNHPPEWVLSPIKLSADQGAPLDVDLTQWASSPDGDTLAFTVTNVVGPTWPTVSSDGKHFGGTPSIDETNPSQVTVKTDDGNGGTTSVQILITVDHVNHPPYWVKNPTNLPDAAIGTPYVQSLVTYAKDPDAGDTLHFTKIQGPTWLIVDDWGSVRGTPPASAKGLNNFEIEVRDSSDAAATASVNINVGDALVVPTWTTPIPFPNGTANVAFLFDLSKYASDANNNTLQFTKVSGPGWMTVSQDGTVGGTPGTSDVGSFTAVFQASNGMATAQTTVTSQVTATSGKGPQWSTVPLNFGNTNVGTAFSFDLSKFVINVNNATLTFAKTQGPAWIQVASNGAVTGTPAATDAGAFTGTVTVSDGTNTTTDNIFGTVVALIQPPVIHPIALKFQEGGSYDIQLNNTQYVDPAGATSLTFQASGAPAWLTVSASGELKASPPTGSAGDYTVALSVSNGTNSASGQIAVHVDPASNPPIWFQDSFQFTATANQPFSQSLASNVTDLVGTPITFSKSSGPAWLNVSSAGVLSGTPPAAGTDTFVILATNVDGSAPADVTITTTGSGAVLAWTTPTIAMGTTIAANSAFTFNLSTYVTGGAAKPTFKLVNGPAWMQVASNGQITGTPHATDAGNFTTTFQATDGTTTVQTGGFGTVVSTPNNIPIVLTIALSAPVGGNVVIHLNDPQYITNPAGGTLTFTLTSATASYFSLSSNGDVKITPAATDVGIHTIQFTVANSAGPANGQFTINVVPQAVPPTWLKDTITLTATLNSPFTGDLSTYASAPDGETLTFAKKVGPAWLTVAPNGKLSGTPTSATDTTFVVTVTDQGGTDIASLTFTFGAAAVPPMEVALDSCPNGGATNMIWLVDHTNYSEQLVSDVRSAVSGFYQGLQQDFITSQNVVGTTSASLMGNPSVFQGIDSNANTQNFLSRAAFVNQTANSPLWSLTQFLSATSPVSIPKTFALAEEPEEVLVISAARDQNALFSTSAFNLVYTNAQYTSYFRQTAQTNKMPLRISVLTRQCPYLGYTPGTESQLAVESTYQDLATATGGTYMNDCSGKIPDLLSQYADLVSARACALSTQSVPLTTKPAGTMIVLLGNTELTGNTGAATDQWTYDSTKNQINLLWDKIDLTSFTGKEKLTVSFGQ